MPRTIRPALLVAPWLFASLIAGCSANDPAAASRSNLWVDPTAVCQIYYTPLKNGLDYVGSIDVLATPTEVTVEVRGTGGYSIQSATIRAGASAAADPTTLPYVDSFADGPVDYHVFHVPLSAIGLACGETVHLAVEAAGVKDGTVVTAWGQGSTLPVTPDAEFTYDICCEPDGGVASADAGVPVGDGAVPCADASAPPEDAGAPAEDAGTGPACVESHGFWKNHPHALPVDSLVLGATHYDRDALLALLDDASRGDASIILAHQLIAALLNAASGATPPADVATAIDDALSFLGANADADGTLPYGIDPRSGAGRTATRLAAVLEAYNAGEAGVASCDGRQDHEDRHECGGGKDHHRDDGHDCGDHGGDDGHGGCGGLDGHNDGAPHDASGCHVGSSDLPFHIGPRH